MCYIHGFNILTHSRGTKPKKKKLADDVDNVNLPLGARKLPAFIALDTDDTSTEQNLSGSRTRTSKKGKHQNNMDNTQFNKTI